MRERERGKFVFLFLFPLSSLVDSLSFFAFLSICSSMSVAGSTSSRGTHSRSRSRSRSRSPPFYNDTRNGPPRYSSRYDSYSYRPSRGPNALDDYRDFRDRDRDRPSMGLREDRYVPRSRDR